MSETVTIPAGVWKDALVKIDAQLKTNGELAAENERLRKQVADFDARMEGMSSMLKACGEKRRIQNLHLKKALKDIEKAWYDQRPGDVIKIVDEALAWRESK